VDRRLLVFHLRAARRRARPAAVAEAVALLGDLGVSAPAGGPLSERGGVFWIAVPERHLEAAAARLPRLGYTEAVDLLVPDQDPRRPSRRPAHGAGRGPHPPGRRGPRWRGRPYRLERLCAQDPGELRERAPDRRLFLFEGGGVVRAVRGYRGGADPLARRALPVCDARLLVNLAGPAGRGILLDPFAGAGGIALEARAAGWRTVTADLDPTVRHGLARLGAAHLVADARALPLRGGSVDAVATEPPYDRRVGRLVEQALGELHRLLRGGGVLAMLCADWQAAGLRAAAAALGLEAWLDCPVNRKGLAVVVLAWRR
jgi:Methyltransferase domain